MSRRSATPAEVLGVGDAATRRSTTGCRAARRRDGRAGPADDLATDVPPLIEEAAQRRVGAYREQAARQGRSSPPTASPAAVGTALPRWRPS